MRCTTIALAALLLTSPLTAVAQDGVGAGARLAAPVLVQAEVEAELALQVPQAPSVASELSSETQPRWPSEAPTGIDPEIRALRAGSPRAPASANEWASSSRRADAAPRDAGPSFGASVGHAAAGFGLGSAAGAIGGAAVGFAACTGGEFCVLAGMLSAGLGAASVAPLGAALGAWGFGEMSGGTGNGFAALGGAYLGAGLGVGVAALLSMSGEGGWGAVLGPASGIVFSMLGAAAGYQLTSHGAREADAPTARVMVLPSVAPTSDGQGASVGAVGRF